ncbi:MAG: long-chain fatty acid--CoA ligase [Bacteroidetes bacterium]|nr:long-chain fatty acid--CoA ligase [Bacteroidota bacterium]
MEFTRLFDAFYCQLERHPLPDAVADKINGTHWVKYSTLDCIAKVNECSRALLAYGIKPGQNVAIVSPNRPEWIFTDMGLLQIGAICVPVYPNISLDEYRFIFNDAEIKLAFVEDKSSYNKIAPLMQEIEGLKIYTFNTYDDIPSYQVLLKKETQAEQSIVEELKQNVKTNDLASIIYTSGTTGTPKGVMLSHENIISDALSAWNCIPIKPGHKLTSMLPICHILERVVTYLVIYVGASLYIIDRLEHIGEYIREVKPNVFTTVPRLLEKIYEKIVMKGNELKGIKKKIFFWALAVGERYDTPSGRGLFYNMQLAIANKLVFVKWREALGGNLFGIVSGAAALQPRLGRVFTAAGIPVKEGYGQTEASPVITLNAYGKNETRFGTVGKPIPNVEVKIAEDGEICARGKNIMLGYYKRPDLTAETIDDQGWLHTGDIGKFDEDGFLKITDRKKELFKTSGGKYVAPQAVENKFKESFFIEHIIVVGENQKTISALITPAYPALNHWANEQGLKFASHDEMLKSKEVIKLYQKIRDEANKTLGEVEKVKKFSLIVDVWGIDSGELTHTMKLKRKFIHSKYQKVIDGFYDND